MPIENSRRIESRDTVDVRKIKKFRFKIQIQKKFEEYIESWESENGRIRLPKKK